MPAAVAPWKVTEQVPVADKLHAVALSDPPVVPAESVTVTVPVGKLEAVPVSVPVGVHVVV